MKYANTPKRVVSDQDLKTVYEIMKKYEDVDPKTHGDFLHEELAIDAFFRKLQTEVTAHHISEQHGTGDNGGFFFINSKTRI